MDVRLSRIHRVRFDEKIDRLSSFVAFRHFRNVDRRFGNFDSTKKLNRFFSFSSKANENVVRFLPSVFRHCINLIEQSVISQIFDLLVQINTWLLKIPDSNIFYVGIGQLLKVKDVFPSFSSF